MKAIRKQEHEALVTAFQRLELFLPEEVFLAGNYTEQVADLASAYRCYNKLLVELAACITEYDELYRHLRTQVLAPAMRRARNPAKAVAPCMELAKAS